jgi:hypothetical protein
MCWGLNFKFLPVLMQPILPSFTHVYRVSGWQLRRFAVSLAARSCATSKILVFILPNTEFCEQFVNKSGITMLVEAGLGWKALESQSAHNQRQTKDFPSFLGFYLGGGNESCTAHHKFLSPARRHGLENVSAHR